MQALRQGDSLVESFTYQARDLAGATDAARLTVTIHGAWDAPVAVDDANVAAAGTIRDPSKGLDAVGNVLPNDTDVDANDTKTVTAIGVGAESSNPALTAVAQPDQPVQGLYGRLLINADGSYTYTVDVLNLTVQALQPGQTLDEYFTYQVSDAGNLNDTATLHIVVRGINNPPFTLPDQGDAVEAGGLDNGTPGVNPRGNVLANDIDLDGDALTITGIRTGPELGTGTDGTVGQVLHGQYGDLLILANGDWSYVVNNSLAAVQALRISGQTLEESFTYTVADIRGDTDTGLLRIVIDGRNDTPLAHDDAGEALEAGGIDNGTPGKDSVGNVLDNDTDVDSVANGESRHVVNYTSAAGVVGDAGSTVAGIYGSLVIGADGSWRYVVDNNNAAVQALRTNGETLTESFSYLMRDTEGATSRANLVIVVRGANDNPVARDDSNVASDQVVAPQATGNVLPNDSDVDGGDALHVSAIRTGAEGASGTAGQLGQALAGRYGTLVIHADGSYTYSIDLSNPEVLAAAGMGRVLQDLFTYTVSDRAGATDLAQLTISLDISAPRIDNGDPLYFQRLFEQLQPHTQELGYEPAIFVQPVVRQSAFIDRLEQASSDGTRLDMVLDRGLIAPPSLGANLGQLAGQFVGQVVRENQLAAQLELARLTGRHGRVSLGADGLLSDPSTFSLTDDGLTKGEAQRPGLDGPAPAARPAADARSGERNKQKQARATTAPGFSEQLRRAAGQASPTHR
ncbi:MAG: VCBS domain-containing protein [Proteobacteria bacterium]|nr:VCBS domain-containing protein [Pseudomonadota bacterium]